MKTNYPILPLFQIFKCKTSIPQIFLFPWKRKRDVGSSIYSVFLTYLHLERTTELLGSSMRQIIVQGEYQVAKFICRLPNANVCKYQIYKYISTYIYTYTYIHDENATILFALVDYFMDYNKTPSVGGFGMPANSIKFLHCSSLLRLSPIS